MGFDGFCLSNQTTDWALYSREITEMNSISEHSQKSDSYLMYVEKKTECKSTFLWLITKIRQKPELNKAIQIHKKDKNLGTKTGNLPLYLIWKGGLLALTIY